MKNTIRALAVAAAIAALAVPAQASTTTLTFSELVGIHSTLNYTGTAGGNLTVSSNKGKLVIVLGELGVATLTNWDPRLGPSETITFSFSQAVNLSYWDMDDLNLAGSNQFGLRVDGGANKSYSLDSHGPASTLTGQTFTFAYKGDAYFIDTLKFSSVSPVPEPAAWALAVAGMGVVAGLQRRRAARAC